MRLRRTRIMGEQFGLIYWIDPIYIASPNTTQGLRIYRSTIDNLYYVKKSDGTSELFSAGLGPIGGGGSQFRGGHDASGGTFPAAGGSGVAGAIIAGDSWVITVGGILCGEDVVQGDVVIALIDAPGQVCANWTVIENNIGYVPENVANKATDFTIVNHTLYPSVQAVEERLISGGLAGGTPGQVLFYDAAGNPTGEAALTWDFANDTLNVGIVNGSSILNINGGNGLASTFSVQGHLAGANNILDVYNSEGSRKFLLATQNGEGVGTTAYVEVMQRNLAAAAATFYDFNSTFPRVGFGGHVSTDAALLHTRNDIVSVGSDALFLWQDGASYILIDSEKTGTFAIPFIEMFSDDGALATEFFKLTSKGDSYWVGDTNRIGFGTNLPSARVHIKGVDNLVGTYAVKVDNLAGITNLFSITNSGVINILATQTGNAALVSGDLYVDTPANIAANGDLTVARKV